MTAIRMIAGSGRSGTTWVQDALATANRLRPVFEPLHPHLSQIGNKYAHRALIADEDQPELKDFLIRASAGCEERLWTRYRQQLRWLFPPVERFQTRQDAVRTWRHWVKFVTEFPRMTLDGRRQDPLVKCIRANLMLPWLARHLDCRLALIVRHPGAVIESELRSGWDSRFALERFRNDATLRELTGGRYHVLLNRQLDRLEALTARWIVENQWVMEVAVAHGIPIIHYEKLRSSESSEWERLCVSLSLEAVPKIELLTRPSQQSGADRPSIPLEQSKMPRWMSALTSKQKDVVRGILDSVELMTYSMDDPLPRQTKQTVTSVGSMVARR